MRLPAPLLRNKPKAHKNDFGHVLILAGSPTMLGAAALTSLAAMRSGAGLVTLGVPKNLNLTAQRKINHAIMTLPLAQTKEGSLSFSAFKSIQKSFSNYDALAIGPGLGTHRSTQRLILKIISHCPIPLVIDADALNVLVGHLKILNQTKTPKILTPHPGEMARLVNKKKSTIENNRQKIANEFTKHHDCCLLLKGHRSIVAQKNRRIYVNHSGNAGMATAGSGDVLTGMIAAFLGQGLSAFDAAKWGSYLHGLVGDLTAKSKTKVSMTASDMLELIPRAIKTCRGT